MADQGTILIVDDLETNREIMSRMLDRSGYITYSAKNGQQALDIVIEIQPDLILLDVSMPGMDGFEVCRRIKADQRTEHIAVIFISALSELGDKMRAFEAGAVDYIIKPFQVAEVLARVESQIMLARQRQQILALSDLKDQLIRTVSHDLKNPIHIVMGYAALMMEPVGMDQDQMIEMSTQIFNSAEKMFTLVTNLLDLTQIEDGIKLNLQPLDLREIMGDLMNEFHFQAEQKQITLEFAVGADLPPVPADAIRLRQVFSNLISNALKYTPAGGTVQVSAQAEDNQMVITVSDNGLGIPSEALPNLFDKFYRVNTTEHKEQEGTGLGLSIAQAIVQEHNGQIQVQSEDGAGSAFNVILPLTDND
jgi:two-component system, sensor histidine kinase and response regulator